MTAGAWGPSLSSMVIEAIRLSRSQPIDIELHSPANLARMSPEQRLAHESACKSAIKSLQVQLDHLHPMITADAYAPHTH